MQEPENSKVTNNGDGTLTIVFSENEDDDRFFAPALVIVYKDDSGELQEVKKEFAVAQQGDVPSLIQTGGAEDPSNSSFPLGGLALIFALLLSINLFRKTALEKQV